MVTFNMSRSASYFESGIGRGMGFRDCSQDLLGFVHLIPERARERILDIAATQLPDGSAYHQYQPLTKRGNSDAGNGFNDDPLWLIYAVDAYLKETGDFAMLDESVDFNNDPSLAAPLMEHLRRVLPLHRGQLRTARPAADRPRGLERLPEPELLFRRAGRKLPDGYQPRYRHRRERVYRRNVRRRGGRLRGVLRAAAAMRMKPLTPGAEKAKMVTSRSRRTAGTANGSCARTTPTATRSAPANATKEKSSSNRRACA